MGDTELKNYVPFINSLKGNSGTRYNYIGQANVSSMIDYTGSIRIIFI